MTNTCGYLIGWVVIMAVGTACAVMTVYLAFTDRREVLRSQEATVLPEAMLVRMRSLAVDVLVVAMSSLAGLLLFLHVGISAMFLPPPRDCAVNPLTVELIAAGAFTASAMVYALISRFLRDKGARITHPSRWFQRKKALDEAKGVVAFLDEEHQRESKVEGE